MSQIRIISVISATRSRIIAVNSIFGSKDAPRQSMILSVFQSSQHECELSINIDNIVLITRIDPFLLRSLNSCRYTYIDSLRASQRGKHEHRRGFSQIFSLFFSELLIVSIGIKLISNYHIIIHKHNQDNNAAKHAYN